MIFLTESFEDNRSVNYIVKQDKKRNQRIRKLMEYSFEMCYSFGEVFLSENKKGCVLIMLPDKKKTTLKTIVLDANLVLSSIGLLNTKKALNKESKIKKFHPDELMYYLWFIGVDPMEQHKGIGSALMRDVITESIKKKRSVYLETSTLKNIPWYEKFGFTIYNELDLGYRLYFMKKNNNGEIDMLMPGTQMHIVTFIFVCIEIVIFFYLVIYKLARLDDTTASLNIILISLLITYNVTGGLLPDPNLPGSIFIQEVIAYGTGFITPCFFPYYVYKAFGLEKMKFHAYKGVFLFLMLPYFLFVIVYAATE